MMVHLPFNDFYLPDIIFVITHARMACIMHYGFNDLKTVFPFNLATLFAYLWVLCNFLCKNV